MAICLQHPTSQTGSQAHAGCCKPKVTQQGASYINLVQMVLLGNEVLGQCRCYGEATQQEHGDL
jgi:hypothetical protein